MCDPLYNFSNVPYTTRQDPPERNKYRILVMRDGAETIHSSSNLDLIFSDMKLGPDLELVAWPDERLEGIGTHCFDVKYLSFCEKFLLSSGSRIGCTCERYTSTEHPRVVKKYHSVFS